MVLPHLSIPSAHLNHHNSTCFILHGLGDSGKGWADVAQMLARKLPRTKFILPHAPEKPITLNQGNSIPAWYDIVCLSEGSPQDKEGIIQSAKGILELVAEEEKRGISRDKIVIGGFSQGGAVALTTGLLFKQIDPTSKNSPDFAGIMALSTYLPIKDHFEHHKSSISSATPILMCHGTADQVISYRWAEQSRLFMKDHLQCKALEFESFPNLAHSINEKGINSMAAFLKKVFNYEDQ